MWFGWGGGDYSGTIAADGTGGGRLCRDADAGCGVPARIRPVSRQAGRRRSHARFWLA
ncbi:hypothetical protein AvCA_04310 [Azotobacter vinelandii CA]|uniref:Uncharacterized protein n=2 Tax=Azotobacter vinelandii TaxID=354 RepID=C1DJA2_AZOVD|nr:hypothetical protein Avin_04310 [Azotobacter vinelandii DJ]AGK15612.1 hypothetical protein AvCA_04310 [Azotobacter vinelandii CA]AGK19295.1 hypothetical protein AvCA6_04310 [Azotobacter vinelandii CA6]